MSCIKTGAHVLLSDYDRIVVCDLYKVGDCIIMRSNPHGLRVAPSSDELGVYFTHEITIPQDSFWRDDIGILVVPERYCKVVRKLG